MVVAAVLASTPVAADWQVKEKKDAMTDEVRKSAYVTNEAGHTFSIYRISEKGSVWGNFSLSSSVFDQISPQKPPMYRVDQNEPNELSRLKELQDMKYGIQAYEWEPKWVNFRIWHGKEDEGMAPDLVQLMEGQKVVFRYHLGTGGYKDTSFTLKGASSAIAKAIGINEKIDHSKQEKANEFKKELVAQNKRCRENMSTFKACFAQVNECRQKSNNDVQTLRQCLGQ